MQRTSEPVTTSIAPRIAIFTHDSHGLGHVRRCLHIARATAAASPDAAILFVTGSPALHVMADLPPHVDYVKIPTTASNGQTSSRHLPIAQSELALLRKQMIRQAIVTFAPDVFLVDNYPLGSQNELLETLQELRGPSTRTVLGLRDILDEPATVGAEWKRHGMYEVLERYYDRILIYGIQSLFDVRSEYALPQRLAAKVHFCGYVADPGEPSRSAEDILTGFRMKPPLVLVTGGGGGDAFALLRTAIEALASIPDASCIVVTGPLMPSRAREELRALAQKRPQTHVLDYVTNLPSYIAAADVTVSMCGYNTVAEIVALGARGVVVPRTARRGPDSYPLEPATSSEQILRATAFAGRGLVRMVEPHALGAASLARAIRDTLDAPRGGGTPDLEMDGVANATQHVLALASDVETR
jgi:predicted glycosyltransferase